MRKRVGGLINVDQVVLGALICCAEKLRFVVRCFQAKRVGRGIVVKGTNLLPCFTEDCNYILHQLLASSFKPVHVSFLDVQNQRHNVVVGCCGCLMETTLGRNHRRHLDVHENAPHREDSQSRAVVQLLPHREPRAFTRARKTALALNVQAEVEN